MKRLIIIGILILVTWGGVFSYIRFSNQLPKSVTSTLPIPTKVIEPKPNFKPLKEKLLTIIEERPGTWGIVVRDLNENGEFLINENKVFHVASVSKVLTAVSMLQLIEDGDDNLDRVFDELTIREHITRMLNFSDNESWAALNKTVGLNYMQQYGMSLGMNQTVVYENLGSPNDYKHLFEALYFKEILSDEHREFLFNTMKNTIFEERIPAGIPDTVEVIHKTGSYELWVHDAGIVMYKRPFILIIMGEGTTKEEALVTIPMISKEVYEFYESL